MGRVQRAMVLVGVIGGLLPTAKPARAELRRSELNDWVDPSTGSTAHAGRACEQSYVARLTGTRAINYLELELSNDSDDEVAITLHSQAFGGQLRRYDSDSRPEKPVHALGNSWKFLSYQLDKPPFYRLRQFDVELHLSFSDGRTCQVKVEFSRALPAAPATYKISPYFEVGGGYGVYAASGSLRDAVGNVGASSTAFISWYPAVQHGLRVESGYDRLHGDRFGSGIHWLLGYEYRIFLGPRFTYAFGVGAGAYRFGRVQGHAHV